MKKPSSWLFVPALAAGLSLLFPASALRAVDVSFWTHSSQEDHAEATLENIAITNYGDIQLSRRLEMLAKGLEGVAAVYALAEASDGTVYAATGPEGVLLRLGGDEPERFELPDAGHLFALTAGPDGSLLVGTGGERGKVLRVGFDGDSIRLQTLFEQEDVRYVWQILRHDDGTLYVATGPDARLYEVRQGQAPRLLFTADGENNLLSIVAGEGDDLYVGSDPNGLVWRVSRQSGEAAVLFDAEEPEITALARVEGSLYAVGAARGEADRKRRERAAGRPSVTGGETVLRDAPPEAPERPELPPVEPDRIPVGAATVQDEAPTPPEEPRDPEAPEESPETPDEPEMPVLPDEAEEPEEPGEPEEREPGEREPRESEPRETRRPSRPRSVPGGFGSPTQELAGEGSAIYRIDLSRDRSGLVTGVLRDNALLMDVAVQDNALLIAAGPGEGTTARLLRHNPATNETALLATPDARQITRLLATGDGRILMALANPGAVAELAAGYADEGIFTSAPLDAGAVSTFGTIRLTGRVPEGTQLLVSARSGTVEDPRDNPAGWSQWSEPVEARQYLPTETTPGRFFQYRLILRSEGQQSPSVEQVRVAYQLPNLPPRVTAVEVSSEMTDQEVREVIEEALEAQESPSAVRAVSWEAADPNEDPLTYDIYLRKGQRGEFALLARDLDESAYAWDTKATGDGVYEVRIVASDARGNPPRQGLSGSRVSDPIHVDLTPPQIGDVAVSQENGQTQIALRVADTGGIVARLEYLVTGDPADAAQWIRAFPEDTMADSPQERYVVQLTDVPATGPASLRLRAVDDSGNLAYQTVALGAAAGE